ncbi:hypothetical protein AN216_15510 [Streptomyces oceani]|uniref:Secreted protein n=1 Tax=Streptomyces oceani TaxID=1075402 RepID=A0A1E7KG91_9ACTN|nr:hypothetical protein AN216_15510 [Streptomyces oceani]
MRERLTALRGGPDVPSRPMDARALAALAANPGCDRRALLDGAGVDKGALATALGAPAAFGQSQFAFVRGNAFEARVKAEGGAELIRLLCARTGETPPEAGQVSVPDLTADGPAGRTARTGIALREAPVGGWTLLDHPMLSLRIAGSPAWLEPDAVAVHPDGSWSVVEIKSFPILDGGADPAKVGAAARQAAVYALALEECLAEPPPDMPTEPDAPRAVRDSALLVCPVDFSNLPTSALIDLRKQRAATRRQLSRLTRVSEIAERVPEGTSFDPTGQSAMQLSASVDTVPAAYAPECLASCELAFHCRSQARATGAVTTLGRAVRGELGGLTTVETVLAAANDTGHETPDGAESAESAGSGDTGGSTEPNTEVGGEDQRADPAAAALRRAASLRAEALRQGPSTVTAPTPADETPGAGEACR